jgi:MYXO-CTERM domain-containing protein
VPGFTSPKPVASTPQAATTSAFIVDTTTGTSVSFFSQTAAFASPSSTSTVIEPPAVVQVTETAPGTTHVLTSIQAAGATDTAGNVATAPSTILITSTQTPRVFPTDTTMHTSSSKSSSSSSSSAALATAGANSSSSSGLSAGGKIAVAVVVPVVAVALIVLAALFLWRRRKQRKDAEELRRKEVEEYGFNPNNDPTLPVVGGASAAGDDPSEMTETDGAGYRGWGTTSTARKPSTNLSNGNGAIGVARSTSNSDNGRYNSSSPTAGTNKSSDVQSGDPLVGSPPNGRPLTADSETIGALGAVPSNGNNRQDIHRGPSNASSAYSGAHRSDTSGEGAVPGGAPGQQYYNDGMFYDEGMPQHGPYGDGSYGGGQPVVRDVSARRNTRIENPSVIPHQGTAGIAQNF